jgi:hypothetical protein
MTFPFPCFLFPPSTTPAASRTFVGAQGSAGGNQSTDFSGWSLSAGLYAIFTALRGYPTLTPGVTALTVGGQSGATNFASANYADSNSTWLQGWYIRLTGSPTGVIRLTTTIPAGDVRRLGLSVYRIDNATADAPAAYNTASNVPQGSLSAGVTLSGASGCLLASAYGSSNSAGDYICAASANVSAGSYTPQAAIQSNGTATWSGGVTKDIDQLLTSTTGNNTALVCAVWK